jgi:hypothetical protein
VSDYAADFLKGQRDCKDGKPHKSGKSADYDRGYGTQYEAEAMLTEMGLKQSRRMGMRV